MGELTLTQLTLIGLIFVWSGFVRSGLGFGGSVLSLPFFLLVVDDPLLFLPPIAIHLLIFSSWITWKGYRQPGYWVAPPATSTGPTSGRPSRS
jgi:hypothetical protein